MFNVVCAGNMTGNKQNCPRQLAMQSRALYLYVRCGSSNQIKKIKKIGNTQLKLYLRLKNENTV